MKKTEYLNRLEKLLKESDDLERRSILIMESTHFFDKKLDELVELESKVGLPLDEKESVTKQIESTFKRMTLELDMLAQVEKDLVDHLKKYNELQSIFYNNEIEED